MRTRLPLVPLIKACICAGRASRSALQNSGSDTLTDVHVSLFVNNYMDDPRPCARVDRVPRGEELTVNLHALFNSQILRVTEGDQVTTEITLEHTAPGQPMSQTIRETLLIHNRNALTWDDDLKAAAVGSPNRVTWDE